MTSRWLAAAALILLPLLGGWDLFRSPDARVQRGNDAFAQGRYDDAIGAYEEAKKALPTEPGVDYDLGAALYQKGLHAPEAERDGVLERAGAAFQGAARATDPKLAAQAQNGLGSSLFRRGKFAQAAQELKKGLRLDPENREIRHNLEVALRKKKEEEQQKKQEQQQQPKDGEDPKDPKEPQDGQGKPPPQPGDEPPKDPQAGKDGQPKPEDGGKPEPAKDGQPKPEDEGKPEDGKPEPAKDGQPKPEDGKPEPGKDGQPKPEDGAQSGTPKDGQAEPRREVDRKLDALERRSREAQLRRLRAKAQRQSGRLARPTEDW